MKTLTGVMLFGLLTSTTPAELVPQPIDSTCQPEGEYMRCITEFTDGSTSTHWQQYKGECTYVYWSDPNEGNPNPVEICRIGD